MLIRIAELLGNYPERLSKFMIPIGDPNTTAFLHHDVKVSGQATS